MCTTPCGFYSFYSRMEYRAFAHGFIVDENDLIILSQDSELYYSAGYLALKALLVSLSDTTQRLMLYGFDSTLKNKEVTGHIKDGIMQYIHVEAFLSFAGREITKENVENVIRSLGMEPDEKLIDLLVRSSPKSHLIYVYAYYLLVAEGSDVTAQNICKVVDAVGIVPDLERVKDIFAFVK